MFMVVYNKKNINKDTQRNVPNNYQGLIDNKFSYIHMYMNKDNNKLYSS